MTTPQHTGDPARMRGHLTQLRVEHAILEAEQVARQTGHETETLRNKAALADITIRLEQLDHAITIYENRLTRHNRGVDGEAS